MELPPLCGGNGIFMHTPQGRRIQRRLFKPEDQELLGSIVAISHCGHIQRDTHSRFTVLKHIKQSEDMGSVPWKSNMSLRYFLNKLKEKLLSLITF